MDSPQHEPQRLSALYQYHNAPEVAPAHGLEYDDTVYPSSDKYPVIREAPSFPYDSSNYKGKHAFINDNRPPRIIFGMKVRTFLVVALVMALAIIGAAVGGAVGGKSMKEFGTADGTQTSNTSSTAATTSEPTSTTSEAPSTTSTFAAPTPTYTPISDCPASNDTGYTSSYTQQSSSSSSDAGLKFTKYCDMAGPLSRTGASRIAEAFVYSFSDCIEVCAGYNYLNTGGSNCTVAVYQPSGSRPGNCWVGHVGDVAFGSLDALEGTDVALVSQ
ncbi:hypothetical protein LTR08_002219 [Meristemomyces frigidus]|nr:hypothetical protein LTR08_002219 [Meristemomyces frigidus]